MTDEFDRAPSLPMVEVDAGRSDDLTTGPP
jgi:hypothetical protein